MIQNLAALMQTRTGSAGNSADDAGLRRRVTDAVFSSGAQKSWAENQASRQGLNFADKLFGYSQATTTSSAKGDVIDAIKSPSTRLDRKALTVVAQLQEEVGDNKFAVRRTVQRPDSAEQHPPKTHISSIPRDDAPAPASRRSRTQKPEPAQQAAGAGDAAAPANPPTADKPLQSATGAVRGAIQRSYRSSPSYEALAREHRELLQQKIQGLQEESFLEGTEEEQEIGGLAARFESGPEGIAAIGYDRVGGTSYGKYQLSSRAGTMSRFITYLREEEPEWANKLSASGSANTRGRRGAMPDAWREIAQENPARFEELQDDFIMKTNYHPARQAILEATKVDIGECSPVLQDVLHSTAVQHGPGGASRIFINALQKVGATSENVAEEQLIERVYQSRKQNFGSSSWRVRRAVTARLSTEMDLAIDLLKQGAMVADKDA
ncbi:VgrG-related protein [Megalodesulfovibrio paquesii]